MGSARRGLVREGPAVPETNWLYVAVRLHASPSGQGEKNKMWEHFVDVIVVLIYSGIGWVVLTKIAEWLNKN